MSEIAVYAITPNGRQIREVEVGGKTLYQVQPKDDNYWLWCRTPHAALQAYYAPGRFRAASDRLAAWVEKQKNAEYAARVGYFNDEEELPTRVIARWDAAEWDNEKMVARRYRYEDADTGSAIELTEEEAGRYAWGRCADNLTGGSQAGER